MYKGFFIIVLMLLVYLVKISFYLFIYSFFFLTTGINTGEGGGINTGTGRRGEK